MFSIGIRTSHHTVILALSYQSTPFLHFPIRCANLLQTRHLTPLTRSAMPPCIQLLWDAGTSNTDYISYALNSFRRNELVNHAAEIPCDTRSSLDAPRLPSSCVTEAYPCSLFSFLGDVLCPEVACAIADGHMNPTTLVSKTHWSHSILL